MSTLPSFRSLFCLLKLGVLPYGYVYMRVADKRGPFLKVLKSYLGI